MQIKLRNQSLSTLYHKLGEELYSFVGASLLHPSLSISFCMRVVWGDCEGGTGEVEIKNNFYTMRIKLRNQSLTTLYHKVGEELYPFGGG